MGEEVQISLNDHKKDLCSVSFLKVNLGLQKGPQKRGPKYVVPSFRVVTPPPKITPTNQAWGVIAYQDLMYVLTRDIFVTAARKLNFGENVVFLGFFRRFHQKGRKTPDWLYSFSSYFKKYDISQSSYDMSRIKVNKFTLISFTDYFRLLR